MKSFRTSLLAILAVAAFGLTASRVHAETPTQRPSSALAREVRHELLMLPYYGVFDNLAFRINGNTVTLYGQVVRQSTRSDAARSVSRIEGVTRVINNIEVLPLSSFDDRIRRQTYREIANTAGLYRYLMGANPSLHIVVNRGHVTLTGVVGSRMDRQLAYVAARRVPGTFSVHNALEVDGENQPR